MSHYVIFSSDYIDLPSTNGVCDSVIAKELVRNGNVVDVICYGKEKVYRFRRTKNLNINTICADNQHITNVIKILISRFISLIYYPIKQPKYGNRFFEMFEMIHNKKSVDYVLASQMPAETVMPLKKIRDKYPTIKIGIYALDLLSNSLIDQVGWRQILQYKCGMLERKNFVMVDYVFCLKCNEKFVNGGKLKRFSSKIRYVDIPLISNIQFIEAGKHLQNMERIRDNQVVFIYTGTLLKGFREPNYIIRLLKGLNLDKKCFLDIYSRGTYVNELIKETEKNDCIRFCGYVSPEILNIKLSEADFLVSIGNSRTESFTGIPSKIFSYMSTGKPIIHILGGKYDPCKMYFESYPDVLMVDSENDFDNNMMLLTKFIIKKRDGRVPFETIKYALNENTPEYSARIIDQAFKTI